MADIGVKIMELRQKGENGLLTDWIPLGAKAENVDLVVPDPQSLSGETMTVSLQEAYEQKLFASTVEWTLVQ